MANLNVIVKLLNITQVREKALKCGQYTAKLLAFIILHHIDAKSVTGKRFKSLSKTISTGRRLFKLLRWLQYVQSDLPEVLEEKSPDVRNLMLAEFCCNVTADVLQDAVTLGRVGVIPPRIVPERVEYIADCFELALSIVSLALSYFKIDKQQKKLSATETKLDATDGKKKSTNEHYKLFLLQLAAIKYGADFLKAMTDTELCGSNDLLQCVSGLVSGAISTHKYASKAM